MGIAVIKVLPGMAAAGWYEFRETEFRVAFKKQMTIGMDENHVYRSSAAGYAAPADSAGKMPEVIMSIRNPI